MVVLLSPSKTLNIEEKLSVENPGTPAFNAEAQELILELRKRSFNDIQKLMGISDNLTALNVDRYKNFKKRHTDKNSNAAIKAFQGDVYTGLDVSQFNDEDLAYAQDHVRILSGLYGLLKPLDRMQAYRLEMGTALKTGYGKNLYEYWGTKVTDAINAALYGMQSKAVINLASNEYWKVVHQDKLKAPVLDIDFREERNGEFKFISFNAKKARGTMTRFIVKERIDQVEDLKAFDLDGYRYNDAGSTADKFLFVR